MAFLVSSEAGDERKGLAAVRMRADEGMLVAVLLQVAIIALGGDHLVAEIAPDLGRVAVVRDGQIVAFRRTGHLKKGGLVCLRSLSCELKNEKGGGSCELEKEEISRWKRKFFREGVLRLVEK